MSRFVHLHLHTQYSVLDGAIKIENLISHTKSLGHPAVAITDHGNMHGVIEFYQAAKAAQVKPIIGCEVYFTAGSRHDRTPRAQGGHQTHHLTLLATNHQGYKNLCRLVTAGYLEGFYHKPRIDYELLSSCHDGLICLSGCMACELAAYSRMEDIDGAETCARRYRDLFGERFFLEVQPHQFPEQQRHNKMMLELGGKLGIPLVATNDCHYLSPEDHYAQEVLMCISTGKMITDEDRIRHDHSRLHFKTEDEMIAGMPGFEEAVRHSGLIADMCNLSFDFSKHHMPHFEPPPDKSLEDLFAEQAREGLEDRFSRLRASKAEYLTDEVIRSYHDRLELEIKLITKMGFVGYFLVVSDFIRWAKRNSIPVGPGRGSAAGSLVAYAMAITEVDPIPHKLLFERFLNPDRVSLPDIDIDFCIYGREKVIEYVCDKYGRDRVAQICTFGTLKAKAAIKDVGRALGRSYAETDRIAKLMPAPRQGFDYPLAEALKMEKRLREYADSDEGRELIELAMKLEGLSRHTSTHAAGIVIGDKPIVEHLPLMMDKEGQVVTQLSMSWVEKIGLVKFDFLGLKTLTVLYDAVRMIKEARNKDIELNDLPLDDPRTLKLIASGRTIGVFQLESTGITEMVSRLKPSNFEDLVAILALYRPGPLDAGMVDHYINRKHGRERVTYSHPLLEPVLSDTYGIILYQEQIMQIARDMAGYSLAEADMLRRAMGKKKPEEMAKQRDFFMSGAKARNIPDSTAGDVFDQMETFARYGFNRSHSVAYAMISYQTGYLKAHFPRQFMAALMTSEMGDTDKTLKNINECREMGISVLPPDINRGEVGFSVSGSDIVFGLAAIKGVGEKAVQMLAQERVQNGAFKSFHDFCARCDASLLNRRVLENFIQAGAFDWSGRSRAHLFQNLDDVLKRISREREEKANNQISLFGGQASFAAPPENGNGKGLPEWPTTEKLAREKEALGFYLSGHPLERFRQDLSRVGASTIREVKGLSNDATVNVAGVITFLKLKNTKKGERYASFILEDLLDTMEVLVWPDTYNQVQTILSSDDPVVVSAKLEVGDERRILFASNVKSIIELRDQSAKEAVIHIDSTRVDSGKLTELRKLITLHQGDCRVRLVMRRQNHSDTILSLPAGAGVAPSEEFCNSVERLLGEPAVTFR